VGRPRVARLDPKFGALYRELPAGHWLPAWQAAMRRAERLWKEGDAEALVRDRLLPDEHFDFKGGKSRPDGWCVTPERLSDPSEIELSQS
jgi:hypothetical protein